MDERLIADRQLLPFTLWDCGQKFVASHLSFFPCFLVNAICLNLLSLRTLDSGTNGEPGELFSLFFNPPTMLWADWPLHSLRLRPKTCRSQYVILPFALSLRLSVTIYSLKEHYIAALSGNRVNSSHCFLIPPQRCGQ